MEFKTSPESKGHWNEKKVFPVGQIQIYPRGERVKPIIDELEGGLTNRESGRGIFQNAVASL